jgi:hypothetical protein
MIPPGTPEDPHDPPRKITLTQHQRKQTLVQAWLSKRVKPPIRPFMFEGKDMAIRVSFEIRLGMGMELDPGADDASTVKDLEATYQAFLDKIPPEARP